MNEQELRKRAFGYFRDSKFRLGAAYFQDMAAQALGRGELQNHLNYSLFKCRFKVLIGKYEEVLEELNEIQNNTLYQDQFLIPGSYSYKLCNYVHAAALHYLRVSDDVSKLIEKAEHPLDVSDPGDDHLKIDLYLIELLRGKTQWRKRELAAAFRSFVGVLYNCFKENRPIFNFLQAKAMNLIGTLLMEINENGLALDYFRLSKHLFDSNKTLLDKEHLYIGILCADIANCQLKMLDPDSAQAKHLFVEVDDNLSRANKIFSGIYEEDQPHRYKAGVLKVRARQCRKLGTRTGEAQRNSYFKESKALIHQEIEMREKAYGDGRKHATIARAFNHLARICIRLGQFEEALQAAQEAIRNSLDSFEPQDIETVPQIHSLEDVLSKTQLFKGLNTKTEVLLRRETSEQNLLNAYNTITAGVELIQLTARNMNHDESRLLLIEQTRPLHEHAMEVLLQIFQAQKKGWFPDRPSFAREVYQKIQNNKGFLLYSDLTDLVDLSEMPTNSEPEASRGRLRMVPALEKLTKVFQQHYEANQDIVDEVLDKEYRLFTDAMRADNLSGRVEELKSPALDEIQQNFTQKKAGILSFFIGVGNAYTILITPDTFEVKKICASPEEIALLTKHVDRMQQYVDIDIPNYAIDSRSSRYKDSYQSPIAGFSVLAYHLYKQLIAESIGDQDLTNLYIIPDDFLWKLSFECLVTSPYKDQYEQFFQLPYLLHKYELSYHFSVPLIHKMYAGERKQIERALLCVSSLKKGEKNQLVQTFETWEELIQNADMDLELEQFPSDLSLDRVDKDQHPTLFRLLRFYHLVVLRSHGKTEADGTPSIDVFGQRLFPQDISKRRGHYEHLKLMILHSCYNGTGTIRKGEGTFAFNRAFVRAGVQNLIYTTSDVNTSISSKILTDFWKYLLTDGGRKYTVSQALWMAKVDHSKREGEMPTDWCTILFLGDQTLNLRGTQTPFL